MTVEHWMIDVGFWASGFITGFGVCGWVLGRKSKKNQEKIIAEVIKEIKRKSLESVDKSSYNKQY